MTKMFIYWTILVWFVYNEYSTVKTDVFVELLLVAKWLDETWKLHDIQVQIPVFLNNQLAKFDGLTKFDELAKIGV